MPCNRSLLPNLFSFSVALGGLVPTVAACTQPKSDLPPVALPDSGAPPPAPAPGPSCERTQPCSYSARGGEPEAVSCCDSVWVAGATFQMGFSSSEVPRATDNLDFEDGSHDVRVDGYFLDRFEVTRGRFAEFVRQFSGPPTVGSGRHPLIEQSGWNEPPGVDADWDPFLPPTPRALVDAATCPDAEPPLSITPASEDFEQSTANADAGDGGVSVLGDERLPIACVTWFMAFAFCIWDGGRLPTEAEWELAAADGASDLPYPWGDDPSVAQTLRGPDVPVGTESRSTSPSGLADLAGGAYEWALDWFSEDFYVRTGACDNCANLEIQNGRVLRGADDTTCCSGFDSSYRSAARNLDAPRNRIRDGVGYGIRCARDVTMP